MWTIHTVVIKLFLSIFDVLVSTNNKIVWFNYIAHIDKDTNLYDMIFKQMFAFSVDMF